MAIIPDDIKNLDGQEPQRKQNIIYEYIKYMREQIEFWAQNRLKDITNLFTRVEELFSNVADLDSKKANRSGDTFTGHVYIKNSNGVANQDNLLALVLGNSTAKTAAGHSEGYIALYGNTGKYTSINAFNSTANRTLSLPDASGTIQLVEDHAYVTPSSWTTTIPSGTTTTVATISLSVGIWIITGGFQFTESFTQGAYIMLNGSDVATIVRGTGSSGGGFSLSHLEKVTSTKSISLQAYQSSGSSKTVNRLEFRAVRISK